VHSISGMTRRDKTVAAVMRHPSYKRLSVGILFALLCVLASSALVWAAPFAKDFQFTQPDNSRITLQGQGDEFHAVFETKTGYTVLFDPKTKAYYYATRAADGKSLVSTGVLAHDKPPRGLNQHIRIDAAAAAAAARAKRVKWDQEIGLSERWKQLKAKKLGDLRKPDSPTLAAAPETSATGNGSSSVLAPPSSTTLGVKQGLTLLIDFSDDPATIADSEIDSFLNSDSYSGYGNNGSVKKYFSDVSNGQLTYTNVVIAYVRMAQPKSYYNDISVDDNCGDQGRLLINDALAILKARPDYTSTILPTLNALTADAYGNVAAFNVYFAGATSGVWSNGLWPHSWVLASPVALGNGKNLYYYQITNVGSSLELGTFCHENGHMLCDFPDLYDYDYDSIGGAGKFSLMGYGGGGTNPSQVDAYLKRAAGWATTIDLTSVSNSTATLTAAPTSGYNTFYRYQKPGVSTEYYLFENRQKTGRDSGLPAAGIAIWHVDELGDRDNQSLTPNTSHANYELTLVQADNLWHFENNQNSGDANDLYYPANTATAYSNAFHASSLPSAVWWDGTGSALTFNSFSTSAATMTFSVAPAVTRTLTVSKTGSGSGTISSSPAGISCGSSCSNSFVQNSSVILTATADSNAMFSGWSGGGCSGTGTCTVSLTTDTTVSASFVPATTTTVLSESFDAGTTPTGWSITDNAGTGAVWRFDNPQGYPNDTGGTGNFAIADSDYAGTVNMDTELRTPVLNLAAYSVVLLKFKTFFDHYSSEIANVDISSNGAAGPWTTVWSKSLVDYIGSEQIDISSLAAGRSNVMVRFRYYNANYDNDWDIDDVVVTGIIPVSQPTLTVNHAYTAAGVVKGGGSISGSGISCSSVNGGTKTGTCSASFNSGSTVTLAAAADANSTFSGWSGGGCSGIGGCSFSITADTTVTGSFAGAYKVRISGGNGYDTLTLAHTNAASGATILARQLHNATTLAEEPFTENLTVTKAVTLKGGYNAGFSSNAGLYSTLSGILTIGDAGGSLTVENLIIR